MKQFILAIALIFSATAVRGGEIYNWSGAYVGVHAGWQTTKNVPLDKFDLDSAFGGLQIGHNWQFQNNIVVGVEIDQSLSYVQSRYEEVFAFNHYRSLSFFGTARGRVGYAFGNVLPYITAGYGWVGVGEGPFGFKGIFNAAAYGAGFDWAFADRWIARIEYLRLQTETKNFGNDFNGNPVNSRLKSELLRIGFNYRFN